jgi:hypothetical protein
VAPPRWAGGSIGRVAGPLGSPPSPSPPPRAGGDASPHLRWYASYRTPLSNPY